VKEHVDNRTSHEAAGLRSQAGQVEGGVDRGTTDADRIKGRPFSHYRYNDQ